MNMEWTPQLTEFTKADLLAALIWLSGFVMYALIGLWPGHESR